MSVYCQFSCNHRGIACPTAPPAHLTTHALTPSGEGKQIISACTCHLWSCKKSLFNVEIFVNAWLLVTMTTLGSVFRDTTHVHLALTNWIVVIKLCSASKIRFFAKLLIQWYGFISQITTSKIALLVCPGNRNQVEIYTIHCKNAPTWQYDIECWNKLIDWCANYQHPCVPFGVSPVGVSPLELSPMLWDCPLWGVPCGGVPCRGVPCGGVPCGGVPCGGVPCGGVPCRGVPCGVVPCGGVPLWCPLTGVFPEDVLTVAHVFIRCVKHM